MDTQTPQPPSQRERTSMDLIFAESWEPPDNETGILEQLAVTRDPSRQLLEITYIVRHPEVIQVTQVLHTTAAELQQVLRSATPKNDDLQIQLGTCHTTCQEPDQPPATSETDKLAFSLPQALCQELLSAIT